MKIRSALSILALTAAAGGAAFPSAAPAAVPGTAAVSGFDGRVVSVNRDTRRFRVNDLERGVIRIQVTRNTRFERLAGFAAVKKGVLVDVTAKRSSGRWVATLVERKRRGGN
jgi:Domain of unknown function (DUF5666)